MLPPFAPPFPSPMGEMGRKGFKNVADGFLLREHGGGGKLPQIFCEDEDGVLRRSDDVLDSASALMKLVVLYGSPSVLEEARHAVQRSSLPKYLLNEDSIIALTARSTSTNAGNVNYAIYPATPEPGSCFEVRSRCCKDAFRQWLGKKTLFAILRPDFHVFALLETEDELDDAGNELGKMGRAGTNDAKL